jgi:hypothetical protein
MPSHAGTLHQYPQRRLIAPRNQRRSEPILIANQTGLKSGSAGNRRDQGDASPCVYLPWCADAQTRRTARGNMPLPAARTTASGGIHQRLLWISHANRKHPPAQRNQLAQTLPKAKKRSSRPQDRNLRSKDRYHPSPHSSNRNRLSPARTDTRARKSNPPTSTPVVGLAWRAYPPSVQTLAKNIHV